MRPSATKSEAMSVDEVLRALPGLNPNDLTGAVRYFDGSRREKSSVRRRRR